MNIRLSFNFPNNSDLNQTCIFINYIFGRHIKAFGLTLEKTNIPNFISTVKNLLYFNLLKFYIYKAQLYKLILKLTSKSLYTTDQIK